MHELTPIPIEYIQQRMKSPENPAPRNYAEVAAAVSTLVTENSLVSGELFSLHHNVALTMRDGSVFPATFTYESYRNDRGQYPSTSISLHKDGERCAYRYWTFSEYDDEIHAFSISGTENGWEANGLGVALLLQTNEILTHQAVQFRTLWNHDEIVGIISDVAWSPLHDRRSWTTDWAKVLGYEEQWSRLLYRYPIPKNS